MMVTNKLILLLLLFVATCEESSAVNKNEEAKANIRTRRELNSRELERDARIIVNYRGPRGRRAARKCARNIIQDSDSDNVMIIQGNGFCINQLFRDTNIAEVEFDEEVFALGLSESENVNMASDYQHQPAPGEEQTLTRELDEIYPWGLEMIQADQVPMGNNNVTVCIVDTGIAMGHPDLSHDRITGADRVKFYGPVWHWDRDVDGHGTHVAGTIAALSGNDMGVAGAGNFKLHIVRALGDDGRGYESDIHYAVEQCVEAGANIINLSIGGTFMSSRSRRFYTQVVEQYGIMLIAAAGNDGTQGRHIYPASHPSVIAVGAVYEWGAHWPYSNRNNQVELVGPGHNIMSTTSTSHSVQTSDFAYTARHIPGTPDVAATGELVYCEADDDKCRDAEDGKICIFAKDGTDVANMIRACEEGGGAGAIIFAADGSNLSHWSARGQEIGIPAVALSESNGRKLLEDYEDEEVTIGDSGNDGMEYSYSSKSGTSMASPHVAAAAALLWSNFEDCSNHQIRYAMTRNAENPDGECNQSYGYGIVKTKDAFDWLSRNPCSDWDVPQASRGGCTTV